ncbi:MAG TPA: OB-fold nucleic acid binding domain-containing protein [Polyangiaceae bacterium]
MKMAYVLGAAVAAAALLGYADRSRRPTPLSPVPTGTPAPMGGLSGHTVRDGEGSAISGRVLETIAVAKYTYLRLSTDQGETWTAVPSADVSVGASVTVDHAARMDHFTSTTLKRTFDVIYFGSLAGPDSAGRGLPAGHSRMGSNAEPSNGHAHTAGEDPGIPEALLGDRSGALPLDGRSGALPPGHPSIGQGASDSSLPPGHPGATATAASTQTALVVPKLARASGPNGLFIADVFAGRARLAGQKVRVRGMVTKVTLNVLGATFLHLHDGSGDPAAKTDDLTVKTLAQPARGDLVILEGVLRKDVDVGAGYQYPVLLEDAVVVKE